MPEELNLESDLQHVQDYITWICEEVDILIRDDRFSNCPYELVEKLRVVSGKPYESAAWATEKKAREDALRDVSAAEETFTTVKPSRRTGKRQRQSTESPPIALSKRFEVLTEETTDSGDAAAAPTTAAVSQSLPAVAAPPPTTVRSNTVRKAQTKPARKQTRETRASGITVSFVLPASLCQLTAKTSSAPRVRPSPAAATVQCFACQGFNHRAAACTIAPRCVRCSGSHAADKCDRPRDRPATCANCGGSHPANYRGCAAWKEVSMRTKQKPAASAPQENKQPSRTTGRRAQIAAVCKKLDALLAVIPGLLTADASEMAELAGTKDQMK